MPFASRENLRELIVRENKRYLDEKKKAAAEAAGKAIEQLSVMCDEASSKNENFLVANLGDGLDAKVLGIALYVIKIYAQVQHLGAHLLLIRVYQQ